MVDRLKLPPQLRRSLACTKIIENMMGSIRRVCRNVERWHDTPMAPHGTGAAMLEVAKGLGRLKADKPTAGAAGGVGRAVGSELWPRCCVGWRGCRRVLSGNGRQATFNKRRTIPAA